MYARAFSFSSHTSYHHHNLNGIMLLWHKTTTKKQTNAKCGLCWISGRCFLVTNMYDLSQIWDPAGMGCPDLPVPDGQHHFIANSKCCHDSQCCTSLPLHSRSFTSTLAALRFQCKTLAQQVFGLYHLFLLLTGQFDFPIYSSPRNIWIALLSN